MERERELCGVLLTLTTFTTSTSTRTQDQGQLCRLGMTTMLLCYVHHFYHDYFCFLEDCWAWARSSRRMISMCFKCLAAIKGVSPSFEALLASAPLSSRALTTST